MKNSGKFLLFWLAGILLSVQAFAQSITIRGNVKDNTGMGIIGANILVKGTTNGTITDFDGNFTLDAQKVISSLFHLLDIRLRNFRQLQR